MIRNILLLMIFWFALACGAEGAEEIDKGAGETSNVMVTIFWFNSLQELREWVAKNVDGMEFDDRLSGFSLTGRYKDRDFCHMDMFVVRPTVVDGEHTLTIGHELLHCVYGEDYHEVVD